MLAQELARTLAGRGVVATQISRDECDITDRAQVARLFQTRRPTLLLNCAAHTAVDLCEDEVEKADAINGTAVGTLAEFSGEFATKLIHFSTDFVFDGQSDRPYRPNDTPAPLSAYGRSKLLGEEAVKNASPPGWITVRTSWLFGRYGNCFPQIILDRARGGHVLKVVDDQHGCPTYAVDLALAVFELVDRGAQGMWHVTNASPTTWYEFAKETLAQFNVPAEVTPITTAQWVAMRPKQAKRPLYSVLDLEPYARLTGAPLRDWHDALRDYRTEFQKS